MKKLNILILGDLILDHYSNNKPNRVSPEAPVIILDYLSSDYRLGGAANVALNVKKLGANPILISRFYRSKSKNNKIFLDLLKKEKIKTKFFFKEKGEVSLKTRVASNKIQILRLDKNDFIIQDYSDKIFFYLKKIIKKIDAIIISDYQKGFIKDLSKSIKLAKKYKIPVFVDSKGSSYSKFKNSFCIKPNLKEFENIVGKIKNDKDLLIKAKKLIKKLKITYLLLTLGEKGAFLFEKDKNNFEKSLSYHTDISDVTGAGDTVIASFCINYLHTNDKISSLNFAAKAASISVSKHGTYAVSYNEVLQENNKICSLYSLSSILRDIRLKKKTIVLTNGCFDLIHPGHIKFLTMAKKLGDILIIALNSDKSVKENKGISRPINSENNRELILNALSVVDIIVKFDEKTPLDIIKKIRPDFLVKGGDYKGQEIIGEKFVRSYGGTVLKLEYFKSHSTTEIINKILDK